MVWVVWSMDPTVDADQLLRQLAAERLGLPAADVRLGRLCPRCGGSGHGRPVVVAPRGAGAHLSLARTDGLVAVAATTTGRVGVDVERESATDFAGFADVALHPGERDGTTHDRAVVWTRKEAVLKALGRGVMGDLADVHVGAPQEPAHAMEVRSLGAGRFWVDDLEVPAGYAAAVAVVSERPGALRVRRAAAAAPGASATCR